MITIIIISNSNISTPFVIFFGFPIPLKTTRKNFFGCLNIFTPSQGFFGGSNIFTLRTLLNFQAERKIEWVRGDGKSYQPDLLFHFTRYSLFDIREKNMANKNSLSKQIHLFFLSDKVRFTFAFSKPSPPSPFSLKLNSHLLEMPSFVFCQVLICICLRNIHFISIFVKIRLVFLSDILPHPPVAGLTLTSLPQRWFLDHFEIGKYWKNS